MTADEVRGLVSDAVLEALNKKGPTPLLQRAEMAEFCKVSLVTFDKMVTQGLPFVRCGHGRRFEPDRVLEYLRARSTDDEEDGTERRSVEVGV